MPFGNTYQPGADMQSVPMQGQQPRVPGTAPQGPAKILSLRLPRNLGQNPLAARQLLTSPGAGGAPDLNAIIQALMRTLQPPMGGQETGRAQNGPQDYFRAQTGPLNGAGTAFPGGGALPAPHIIPGQEPLSPGTPDQTQQVNYGSPWATGVTPMPGEGDPEHNPFFYGNPTENKIGLF
jgi:hypothetical protein